MRIFTTSIPALVVALALVGCGGGKSSTSDSSSGDQTASAAASAAPADQNSTASSAVNGIPEYPGATMQAAGNSSSMGTDAAGKVMSTSDSFDKVYGWYQQKLPAGSERSHVTTPIESAVFTIGEVSSGQTSVTLTTQGGKTMITIARVKM
jgi:hypothetical protein